MSLPNESATAGLKPATLPVELRASELRGQMPLSSAELERAAASASDQAIIGQQRALEAIRLAIGIDAPGYNVFVSGLRSREEREPIVRLLEERAAQMPAPGDWVYVNNFESPEAPVAIYLKAGGGRELRDRMRELVASVREQLPKAFRQEDFEQERATLKDKYNRLAQELFGKLESSAREGGFAIRTGPGGQVVFVPMIRGKPPESPEELAREMAALSEEERNRLAKVQGELQEQLADLMLRQQEMMRELVNDIRSVESTFAARLIAPAIQAIDQHFQNRAVSNYLKQVSEHILTHLDRFHQAAIPTEGRSAENALAALGADHQASFFEYQVNLLVDNAVRSGAPVVSETAPTYRNLFGAIERWVDPFGRVASNFTRIVSGSFLKAHGGFLVIDLEDAVVEPGVWKTLKRSLKTGCITIETFEPFGLFMTSGLKPEPLPIQNKVIVLGGPNLYNLLYFYDSDFAELFKIKAEIRPVIGADNDAVSHYAGRVASLVRRESLPPFDGSALQRVVEFGMRLAGDRERVLSLMEPIDDLAREAAYFARAEGAAVVGAAQVERALGQRVLRLNFIEEEIRRLIANRTLVVDLDGAKTGQVNGLAVLDVGGYAFGRPVRVTAAVAPGQSGVINIEREARLSGSTHDKGIMILNGFLRSRFGQHHPLAMTASICFEQSYSTIDGDSASSTELYALLSALSGVPIKQSLAVTGSVDQHGTVQAIGGANEKIEGFYRVCKAVGLNGRQGVMVPRANLANLMLEAEVVGAVERGEFHIYPIGDVEQGIELLTGVRAGSTSEPGTISYLVDQRLKQMAELIGGQGAEQTRIIHEHAPAEPKPKPPTPPLPQPKP